MSKVYISKSQTPAILMSKTKHFMTVVHYDYSEGLVHQEVVPSSEFKLRFHPAKAWDNSSVARYLLELAMVGGAESQVVDQLAKFVPVDKWHRERIEDRWQKVQLKKRKKKGKKK